MKKFGVVALGGTFDRLHVGHEALLATAFACGRTVLIGVTTDPYLARHPKAGARTLRPYRLRRQALVRYLGHRFPTRRWEVSPISDRYGRAVGPGIDALVVSVETAHGGRAVNAERRRRGLPQLPVVEVPLVLADDLRPVSSTRIRAGLIGPRGERLAPIQLGLLTDEPLAPSVARETVADLFPRSAWRASLLRPSRGGEARSRARAMALRAAGGADIALGIARSGRAGWWVAVAAGTVLLGPRFAARQRKAALPRTIRALLSPGRRKPIS